MDRCSASSPRLHLIKEPCNCGVGELLLICSDGILESFNEADQEFGLERLETELRSARSGSADAVLFSVLGAVQDFVAPRPLTDDMTLVVVNRLREKGTAPQLVWEI